MKYFLLPLALIGHALFGADPEPVTIGMRHTLESKIMGETRSFRVYLPQNYDNGDAYPVLYMTDGLAHMAHTHGTVNFLAGNQRIPDMIVVGVDNTNRNRDLTPTVDDAATAPINGGGGSGGADKFLSFFTDELAPFIETHYRTKPYKVFAGHSFGGLFAVNAFLKKPDAFNAFIAVSPSLWWDKETMTDLAGSFFEKHKKLNTTLYLTLGNEGDRMSGPLARFTDVLAKQKTEGFRWGQKTFDDEDHGSVVLRSHYFALKFVFDGWQEPDGLDFDGMVAHYAGLSKRMGYDVAVPEGTANNMGYRLMNGGDMPQALKVFRWNVTTYPASANVYDSLAECQERNGDLKDAVANYTEAYKRAKAASHPNTNLYKANMERAAAELKKDAI